jgi:titin
MRRHCVFVVLGLWSAALGAATFTVTNNADSGAGSLRQAILDANASAGADTIAFAIGSGPQTITLALSLPITEAVVVDGQTQPGFAGTPIIEVSGGSATSCFSVSSTGTTLRGFIINRCLQAAVQLSGSSHVVEGNYIGTNTAGTAALGNLRGITISNGTNIRIGGAAAAARNVISGNTLDGISFTGTSSGNLVQGNSIGTNATGSAAVPNGLAGIDLRNTFSANTISDNIISGNTGTGILATGAAITNNVIIGNKIGANAAGTAALQNGSRGIHLINGPANNRIGGTTTAERNLISGNVLFGIQLESAGTSGNRVEGNFIGTNVSGTAAIPNGSGGISLSSGAVNNTIGGTVAGAGNVISGNTGNGIACNVSGTLIAGNLIGTNAAGTAALPNTPSGIRMDLATNTTIGGTVAAARNVISGNTSTGISILGASNSGNTITGNYIGTDSSGTIAVGNQGGGFSIVNGAVNTTVGGTTAAARNVISGNTTFGVHISFGATGTIVQGNYIGTDVSGVLDLGNTTNGVEILSASNNTIGGTAAGAGNVISGNNQTGVDISVVSTPATSNVVAGNLIGTNAAGNAAIPNLQGVRIGSATTNNTIGGTAAGSRNVISGNQSNGVFLSSATDNLLHGNFIGTDAAGTGSLSNAGSGVLINAGTRNQIGGTAAGAANRIRFNGTGVVITSGTAHAIRRNSIANQTGLGIDLRGTTGVTANDSGDADTGPNNLQNFPVLTSALLISGTTIVSGMLNSTPSTTFDIEIFDNSACDGSGNGEGLTFVTSTTVTTNAAGNGSFSVTVPSSLNIVTATAADPNGNTSEFSACTTAGASLITINDVAVIEGNSGTTTATFTVTASPTPTVVATVQYATASSSATAPADYLSTSGTLTFNPGETSKTIAVTVNGDVIDEFNETFFVNLTNATNAAIIDSQGEGTVVDDDTATASVNDVTVIEGNPAVFTITLSTPSSATEFVDYATQNGTAVAPGDYTTTSGFVVFAPGELTKTVSVPTIIDTTTETTDETFTLTITTISGFPAVLDGTGVGTIRDITFIPALSTWILMLLAMTLAGVGVLLLRK